VSYAARRERAAALISQADSPTVITRDLPSIRYFTSFSGSNAAMAIGAEAFVLVTDGRYRDQVHSEVALAGLEGVIEIRIDRDLMGALAATLPQSHEGPSVAVDSRLGYADTQRLHALGRTPCASPIDLGDLRQVKDAVEIEMLTQACSITARGLSVISESIRVGETEQSIARRLEYTFAELGAQDRAFPTIVATGPNSAVPHHRPSSTPIARGDLLVVDCGALVDGYHADMTRTFVVGREADSRQKAIHQAVVDANAAGRAAAVPDVRARDVDAAARSVLSDRGFGEHFTHGTGHGVGLAIHEAPMVSAANADTISAGTPITVEPGVYIPEFGGVRIEDTIVVGDPGLLLTKASYDLSVVG